MVALEGYGLKTTVDADFDTTMEQVVAALKEQGFGVLTGENQLIAGTASWLQIFCVMTLT